MSKIREQFEEAIRNNIESGYEDFEPYFTGVDKSAEKCESIADTQSIEFAKWCEAKDKPDIDLIVLHESERNKYWAALLDQFKQEHYNQKT